MRHPRSQTTTLARDPWVRVTLISKRGAGSLPIQFFEWLWDHHHFEWLSVVQLAQAVVTQIKGNDSSSLKLSLRSSSSKGYPSDACGIHQSRLIPSCASNHVWSMLQTRPWSRSRSRSRSLFPLSHSWSRSLSSSGYVGCSRARPRYVEISRILWNNKMERQARKFCVLMLYSKAYCVSSQQVFCNLPFAIPLQGVNSDTTSDRWSWYTSSDSHSIHVRSSL